MSAFHDIILAGAAGQQGYKISRSVRLRSSASAYFNRTPASATNQKTWTYSLWVKRGTLGAVQDLMVVGSNVAGQQSTQFLFNSNDTIELFDGLAGSTTNILFDTTQVFRDPSAWYHLVLAMDTTQATNTNRVKLYVNGLQITSFTSSTYPSQNFNTLVNAASAHYIGRFSNVSVNYLDGYLTEINFIDGQALTPSSFGEYNAITGVWQPKKYGGTYGTNGFYLNFSDPSAATAAAIGKDYSGNGNNWTPNNITLSPTTSASYDSMLDVPTQWADGGNGRGNYCTLNPLVTSALSGGGTLSNGNLRISGTVSVSNAYARGTMALSGKFYAEFYFDVVNATATIGVDAVTATTGALNTSSTSVSYRSGGNKRVLGTESAYGASWVANDVIGVAVDTAANTVEFFKNGVSQGVITSSALFAQGDCVFAMAKDDLGSPIGYANFGQRPFAYTPPTGFKALNTQNLPDSAINNGAKYMAATLYTGNAGTNAITNTVNGASFQPDLVWVKNRASAYSHGLYDSVRGAGNTKGLYSNETSAEGANSTLQNLVSFDVSGFTLGATSSTNVINTSGQALVGWQWKKGATQGFDVVTYTGNGGTQSIAHSLGVAPAMVIFKYRSGPTGGWAWVVYHRSLSAGSYLYLQSTVATQSLPNVFTSPPSSSVLSLGTEGAVNTNSNNYVAYLFAEVAGFSKFGSYTGNGSADGPFVYCGFRPRFVMMKRTDTTGSWIMWDTSRNTYNQAQNYLLANLSDAEHNDGGGAGSWNTDVLSNGFKIRSDSAAGQINANGGTYIFAAFAESPFKNSLAR